MGVRGGHRVLTIAALVLMTGCGSDAGRAAPTTPAPPSVSIANPPTTTPAESSPVDTALVPGKARELDTSAALEHLRALMTAVGSRPVTSDEVTDLKLGSCPLLDAATLAGAAPPSFDAQRTITAAGLRGVFDKDGPTLLCITGNSTFALTLGVLPAPTALFEDHVQQMFGEGTTELGSTSNVQGGTLHPFSFLAAGTDTAQPSVAWINDDLEIVLFDSNGTDISTDTLAAWLPALLAPVVTKLATLRPDNIIVADTTAPPSRGETNARSAALVSGVSPDALSAVMPGIARRQSERSASRMRR